MSGTSLAQSNEEKYIYHKVIKILQISSKISYLQHSKALTSQPETGLWRYDAGLCYMCISRLSREDVFDKFPYFFLALPPTILGNYSILKHCLLVV